MSRLYVLYTLFYISNTFISNARLKLATNQANAKQHPEAGVLKLFALFIHVIIQNKRTYSKKISKTTSASVFIGFYE